MNNAEEKNRLSINGDMPLISVVVPCYQNEKYVERAVDSLIAQTYPNLEIICVNDGSTDRTGTILDELAEKNSGIKVFHKENGGLSSARNLGVKNASGKYIGFIDGDDSADPEMYMILYRNMMEYQTDISTINAVYVYENCKTGNEVFHLEEGVFSAERQLELLLLHKGSASVCTALFSADLCRNNSFEEGKQNEDFLFWVHIIPQIHTIYYQNAPVYRYYIHPGSLSRSGFSKNMIDMVDNTWEAKKLVDEQYPELREIMNRFFLYQRMVFLQFIPPGMIKNNSEEYQRVVRDIRAYEDKIDSNKYLSNREKRILHSFLNHPVITRRYFGVRRTVGKVVRKLIRR